MRKKRTTARPCQNSAPTGARYGRKIKGVPGGPKNDLVFRKNREIPLQMSPVRHRRASGVRDPPPDVTGSKLSAHPLPFRWPAVTPVPEKHDGPGTKPVPGPPAPPPAADTGSGDHNPPRFFLKTGRKISRPNSVVPEYFRSGP
jgi:hypothetical protein